MSHTREVQVDGRLNADVANEIVRLVAEATGRGATRSRAFVDGDAVVCLLEDGMTRAERTLVDGGRVELMRAQRDALQQLMADRMIECVERLTGRTVRTFISGTSPAGEASSEVFLLAPENGLTTSTG
jgi:uncharacterized protein YbcI